ncbi:MAG: aminotransferase class I/II-fold pyridoxal phosphate-dependent enzyme [Pseudomonadota bacterium]
MPVSSLQELDGDLVIYIGTFSKVLFPSARLGYMVLPEALVEECRELKRLGDHHTDSVSQLALMRFIENGDLERHIARMKKVYHKRRDMLISGLKEAFPGKVSISGESAGMHVAAGFCGVEFTPVLMKALEGAGLSIIPIEEHSVIKGRHCSQLILGYAHLSPEQIQEGIRRLKRILSKATE